MKILMVADGHGGETHVHAMADGFKKLGHKVRVFTWQSYFHNYPYANVYPTRPNRLASIYYRFQNKFTFGPAVIKLNADLIKQARTFKPDMVFVYRGTHIYPRTLKALKATGAKVMGFNNDDPFSSQYKPYFWRHFRRGIFAYDHLFAYRLKNLADYKRIGYRHTSLLRSYYIESRNFPIARPKAAYTCDVIFVGHYEADGRDALLKRVMEAGIDFKLFGTGWQASPLAGYFKAHGGLPKPLLGAEYNIALNSAPIALSLLSHLNNDTYTRRSFEIPATGTCMLSAYTDDLADNLFKPNKEAVYFTDGDSLLKQLKKLLANKALAKKIGAAGRARLLKDGHEVTDRCRQVLKTLATL
ncbi:MAG TPA: glycosyltransferase [Alphaproteobacteria bacterium]|nr:glycosyltransferase [Alphaproteobacteria bacterium]